MSDAALAIGAITMAAGGFLLAAGLLALAAILTGTAGAWLFKRMRRTYQLATIWYWLDQLEKRGTHCFQKPTKDQP